MDEQTYFDTDGNKLGQCSHLDCHLNKRGGEFLTKTGDPAVQGEDGGWYQPTVNPFGHGCCDCGLYHQVEFALVDDEGNPVPLPEGTAMALRFTRDEEETARLRNHRKLFTQNE